MTVPPQPYDSPAPEVQGTAAPQAPAPPIPALPARPGASTGATGSADGGAAVTGSATGDGAGEAAGVSARDQVRSEVQNALREVRDGLRDGFAQSGGGIPGQAIVVQPPPLPRDQIPPEVIPIVGIVFSMIALMVIGHPIARAIARAIDRRGERGVIKAAEVAPQIRQLQESVDAMAIELERISEAQRFTAKLMAERPSALSSGGSGPNA